MKKMPFNPLDPDAPLLHPDHPRPKSRRDFLRAGLISGVGTVMGPTIFSMFANPRAAYAALSPDLNGLREGCGITVAGAGKIPFICIDLAGGGNIAGSNVLVGKQGGQLDFLSTEGYAKLGLPGDMVPSVNDPTTNLPHYNTELGLAFHSDSAFLRGILEKTSAATRANINGAVIPARSENDTSNNPHNPMYGLAKYGVKGELLTTIGTSTSESGGNSMAPMAMMDPTARPTKIDRPSDVTGLVDVGDLVGLLQPDEALKVMESVYRLSDQKMGRVNTNLSTDAIVKNMVKCGYLKSADLFDRFGTTPIGPLEDADIVGATGVFSVAEMGDREFSKTASVMKLVMNGYAGAGTISMGGYDYHGQGRSTGEVRDLRAGRCMGAILEYAARLNMPVMLYVFSDGALSSNGMVDNSVDGRGKFMWASDNQSTAASFFLVYNPNGRPQLMGASPTEQARKQQIGYFRASGDVESSSSPAANNVNLLVETVLLNYMALHGEQADFATHFPTNGLGSGGVLDSLIAFQPIVNGRIGG